MAKETELITSTIDDYLLSLAEGVQFAQKRLEASKLDERTTTRYFLPKVDFELRMILEVTTDPAYNAFFGGDLLRPDSEAFHLVMRPVTASEATNDKFRAEVVSTIRGSFLAAPANEGKPELGLRMSAKWTAAKRELSLRVEIKDTLGAPAPGIEVQFNVDREETASFAPEALKSGTFLRSGIALTDASGAAETVLVIDKSEPKGRVIALVIDAIGKTERSLFTVP